MADSTERTHKHRNIIDDLFDLGLIIGGIIFSFTNIELDKDAVAQLAVSGAVVRGLLRKILMRLWGPQIEAISSGEERAAEDPEVNKSDGVPEAAPEDPTNPEPEPALDSDDNEP